MTHARKVGIVGSFLLMLAAASPLPAQLMDVKGKDVLAWGEAFQKGLEELQDWKILGGMLSVMVLAAVLGALIAYHPRTYGKALTLEEAEQPKIFIMYAVVGSIIGVIVRAHHEMAFVVFGIGGLLRFRTDVGPAKDTGRVILVTCIGLSCGILLFNVAILGTIFGWLLVWLLERSVAHRVLVKGLDPLVLAKSAEAYEEVLRENGLQIMSQKMNFVKNQVAFIFRVPGKIDREQLEGLFKDIPPKLQGAVDWEWS
jgi:phosphate/sulfate permease